MARGDAYNEKGNYDRAIADYSQSIQLRPGDADAYHKRGDAYNKKGDYDRAIADYDQSLQLNPYDKAVEDARANAIAKRNASLAQAGAPSPPAHPALVLPKPAALDTGRPAAATGGNRPIHQGRRVALVIGNGAYKSVDPLTNPKNDAAAVAVELTRLGFEVIEKHDLGVAAMRKVLGEFEDKVAGAEWAFVYYAGHGMELNGRNWLIPVDAELVRATDTPDEAIPLERVLDRLAAASKLRIVVLDACRNNPFISRMVMNRVSTRAVVRGLTAVRAGAR